MGLKVRQQFSGDGRNSEPAEVRCDCGCLLARKVGDILELKCRRCKRVVGIAKIISSKGDCRCENG